MLQRLIQLAINEINQLDSEMKYEIIKGDEVNFPRIVVKGTVEEVISDLDTIQSITATNNTLILHEDGAITIISPIDFTYHQTYL